MLHEKQERKESKETRRKQRNTKKAKIVEATKNRARLAEREAGPYSQVILSKGQT